MTAEAVAARKRELREAARRLAGPPPGALVEVQRRLLDLPELRRPGWVALYAAADHEVCLRDVAAVLLQRGARLAFPRVVEGELWLLAVEDLAALTPGHRGIPEPAAGGERVATAEIDVFLVPGLLFDRAGHRLGRGGGHYDRLLRGARHDAPSVGICYAERLVAEVPAEKWDVSMSLVVTETEVLRPGGAG